MSAFTSTSSFSNSRLSIFCFQNLSLLLLSPPHSSFSPPRIRGGETPDPYLSFLSNELQLFYTLLIEIYFSTLSEVRYTLQTWDVRSFLPSVSLRDVSTAMVEYLLSPPIRVTWSNGIQVMGRISELDTISSMLGRLCHLYAQWRVPDQNWHCLHIK